MSAIADMVARLTAAGARADIAAEVVAEAFAAGVATLGNTLPPVAGHAGNTLPVTRSRKAINQANYRARKSAKTGDSVAMAASTATVTPPATPGNASGNGVTSAPLSVLSSFELSQENPKEESKEVVLSTEPRAKPKRGARLPDDWQPTQADIDYATSRGLRLFEIDDEATKFRNYWTNRTDKLAAKPRWDRAWVNWILNFRKAPNGQGQSVVAAADRLLEDVRALKRPPVGELELLQPGIRGGEGAIDVRLLPQGRRE